MRKIPAFLRNQSPTSLQAALRRSEDDVYVIGTPDRGERIQVITPICGGSIDSFEVDALKEIRVPSIRGALRWWWRALNPAMETPTLRDEERKLWGGIGSGNSSCEESSSVASRVRVDVRVVKAGLVVPAGHHEPRRNGPGLSPLPTWFENRQDLAYGLFPLQRSRDELDAWVQGRMPTKPWRTGVEFELRIVYRKSGATADRDNIEKLRDAITVWLAFGGYGARTRRGFGGLQGEHDRTSEALKILQQVPKGVESTKRKRPTLWEHRLLVGPPRRTPLDALGSVLAALKYFRQEPNFARNPGAERSRPGRSRWPEADSLRTIKKGKYDRHKPDLRGGTPSFPRAVFGLPLIVKFKDSFDKPADAEISPESCEAPNGSESNYTRWASPVILRIVRRGEEFVPYVLVLAGHVPREVRVKYKSEEKVRVKTKSEDKDRYPTTCDQRWYHDINQPLATLLQQDNGDALKAFATWLKSNRHFTDAR